MRIFTVAAALLLLLCSSAFGQMPAGPMPCANCPPMAGHGMDAMGSPMSFKMGPDLRRACHADLGALGIPEEARKALEAERLELQKLVIRNVTELKILGIELEQSLASREFDLEAAGKTLAKIAEIENNVREAHLKFLRSLASKLDDKGWEALRGEMAGTMPCGMSMRDEVMPCGCRDRRHCDRCPCDEMQGGMMPCGSCDRLPCGWYSRDERPCDWWPCNQIQRGMKPQGGTMMPQGGPMQGGMMP